MPTIVTVTPTIVTTMTKLAMSLTRNEVLINKSVGERNSRVKWFFLHSFESLIETDFSTILVDKRPPPISDALVWIA